MYSTVQYVQCCLCKTYPFYIFNTNRHVEHSSAVFPPWVKDMLVDSSWATFHALFLHSPLFRLTRQAIRIFDISCWYYHPHSLYTQFSSESENIDQLQYYLHGFVFVFASQIGPFISVAVKTFFQCGFTLLKERLMSLFVQHLCFLKQFFFFMGTHKQKAIDIRQ